MIPENVRPVSLHSLLSTVFLCTSSFTYLLSLVHISSKLIGSWLPLSGSQFYLSAPVTDLCLYIKLQEHLRWIDLSWTFLSSDGTCDGLKAISFGVHCCSVVQSCFLWEKPKALLWFFLFILLLSPAFEIPEGIKSFRFSRFDCLFIAVSHRTEAKLLSVLL